MAFVVEPVLAYVKAFNQRADRLEVRGAVLNCYDSIAIRKAKEVLWAECGTKLEELKLEKIRRRDTSSRSQAEADLEDILDAMEKLDACGALPKLYCEADDLLQLPPAIPARSVSVEVSNLADKIESLQKEVCQSLNEMNNSIKSLSTKAVSTTVTASGSPSSSSTGAAYSKTAAGEDLARRSNIIVFGVAESQSIVHDKDKIDEILNYAVGRNVPVVDAFRLGKLKHSTEQPGVGTSEARPRPILVKLGCAWDRRVVLLAKRKLQEFESGKFFVRADMSVDERAKRRKHWEGRKRGSNSDK